LRDVFHLDDVSVLFTSEHTPYAGRPILFVPRPVHEASMRFAFLFLFAAAACGGPSTESADDSQDVTTPPIELVTPGVYRGPRPTQATLQNLKALGVRNIVDLEDSASAVNSERKIAASLGIGFNSQPMSGFWTPNDSEVNGIEAYLANTSNYPVFVHCEHGQDRTGLIVGLFRVETQHWTPAAAYKEMLAKGFHQILFLLNHYYEEKTGFED
jgi:protein tyrosine/serine phosphatase